MKDFLSFVALFLLFAALIAAVPVAAFIIGSGVAVWFLWNCFKEERNVKRHY